MENVEKSILESYKILSCFQCGTCTGGCPVSRKSGLNIRRLVYETLRKKDLRSLKEKLELWQCTTCKTCSIRCPMGVKPMDLVIAMRSLLVEDGEVPETVAGALESLNRYGNPFGKPRQQRVQWLKELPQNIKVKDLSKGEKSDTVFFVGCTPSYDNRVQKVTRALALLLAKGNMDFAIFGTKEECCGSEIRRLGESGLFSEIVEKNMIAFEKNDIQLVFTSCPHGFNALKNEYPEGKFEVLHSTQLLSRLLQGGKILLQKEIRKTVVYHDSCFLGKQNGIFDEPRFLLHSIRGLQVREFDRSRERSLCCEGGGGRMWVEVSGERGERLASQRINDALQLGAEIIVTSCPFCLLTLDDMVKTMGKEKSLQVMDLLELLLEAVE